MRKSTAKTVMRKHIGKAALMVEREVSEKKRNLPNEDFYGQSLRYTYLYGCSSR
jgi:hypothetical protein